MTESPDKSLKQMMKQKKHKKKALQNFLQTKSELVPAQVQANSTIIQEKDQKVSKQQNFCCICQVDLGDKIRKCGYCNFQICNDHMRKKRKSRQSNKFVRICDNCEDRYLYSRYMKLEVKHQESVVIQESIVQAARDEIQTKVQEKRSALAKLKKRESQIKQKQRKQMSEFEEKEKQLGEKQKELERKKVQVENEQKDLKELRNSIPPSLEEDYKSLELQKQKVIKQILKYEKQIRQASKVKEKRQKQLYQQYNRWQQSQKQKQNNPIEECRLF